MANAVTVLLSTVINSKYVDIIFLLENVTHIYLFAHDLLLHCRPLRLQQQILVHLIEQLKLA